MELCKRGLIDLTILNISRLGHRKYRHLYRQYFRESMGQVHVRNNFLGFSEERSLARIARENRLMEMKQMIEKRLRMKEHFDNAKHAWKWNHKQMK